MLSLPASGMDVGVPPPPDILEDKFCIFAGMDCGVDCPILDDSLLLILAGTDWGVCWDGSDDFDLVDNGGSVGERR